MSHVQTARGFHIVIFFEPKRLYIYFAAVPNSSWGGRSAVSAVSYVLTRAFTERAAGENFGSMKPFQTTFSFENGKNRAEKSMA